MSFQEELKKLTEKIKQYRDEARVQIHLAREDVKDEWDDLEQEWDRFRAKMEDIFHDAENASQETRQAAERLGKTLKDNYEELRNKLK
ncbi:MULTISPECIES: hypothetical protein [Marinobacter]|uniref:Coiled coil domain-containing protein n=1 Tax=Marinobacter suaedae TaxID=3057675 RepID=A0ABT8VWV1_9GAMM|nr:MULTISPECIES: hypothetical protein [unclassified Marinobacter]MBZ2168507.1 hypothetical protein [Marinobacter sp. F4216]MDO3720405.1 hypothetical protein [Marinobacter sp. chi1]